MAELLIRLLEKNERMCEDVFLSRRMYAKADEAYENALANGDDDIEERKTIRDAIATVIIGDVTRTMELDTASEKALSDYLRGELPPYQVIGSSNGQRVVAYSPFSPGESRLFFKTPEANGYRGTMGVKKDESGMHIMHSLVLPHMMLDWHSGFIYEGLDMIDARIHFIGRDLTPEYKELDAFMRQHEEAYQKLKETPDD